MHEDRWAKIAARVASRAWPKTRWHRAWYFVADHWAPWRWRRQFYGHRARVKMAEVMHVIATTPTSPPGGWHRIRRGSIVGLVAVGSLVALQADAQPGARAVGQMAGLGAQAMTCLVAGLACLGGR